MVSRNFIKSIVYGFALMFLAAGVLYGFATIQKNAAEEKAEVTYAGKLATTVDSMRKIEIDEQNLIQRWRAEKVAAGTAIAEFANAKIRRQELDDDFFSRAPPGKFAQIHSQLKDVNAVYMEADDLYREGIFQRRDDFISAADTKVVIAKEKMNSTITQLERLGYKLTG